VERGRSVAGAADSHTHAPPLRHIAKACFIGELITDEQRARQRMRPQQLGQRRAFVRRAVRYEVDQSLPMHDRHAVRHAWHERLDRRDHLPGVRTMPVVHRDRHPLVLEEGPGQCHEQRLEHRRPCRDLARGALRKP